MSSESYELSDNLNLDKISVAGIPKDVFFPEELNEYLRGQIQCLTHANGMLQKTLSEKEAEVTSQQNELTKLKKELAKYDEMDVHSSCLMSAKIVELSKRLRDKNAEVESLRTQIVKANSKLQCSIIDNQEKQQDIVEEKKSISIDEQKQFQDKIASLNNKLFEMKNANLQLKNDLKVANKILQQELGDGFTTIQNVASGISSWRGRAQQIISLQQKNSELLERLSASSERGLGISASVPEKTDNRKLIIEQLTKDIDLSKCNLEETKKKLNGARARIKVLETECVGMKNKVCTATQKNQHDQSLIQILMDQISSLEENNAESIKEKQLMWKSIESENNSLKNELGHVKSTHENLMTTIRDKDNKIQELYNALKSEKKFIERDPMDDKKLQILDMEVKQLLEQIAMQNDRLDEERNVHAETQMSLRKERLKAVKMEKTLRRLEIDNNYFRTQSYSKVNLKPSVFDAEDVNSKTLENLKNKLEIAEEQISILQTRLQILQKEKELDFQRFGAFITEVSNSNHHCPKSGRFSPK